MKSRLVAIFLVMVLIIPVLFGCSDATGGTAEVQETVPQNIFIGQQSTGIWVNGEGKVTAVPDVAILSIGVEVRDASVSNAQAQAATAMTAVVNALRSNGVTDNDIQTRQFSIIRLTRYDQNTQQEVFVAYQVVNSVIVKIKALDRVGATIDAVTQAGGDLTRIDGISFTVEDQAAYLTEARNLAMANAQNKATQLAQLAGVTLGKATYINESGGFILPPTPVQRSVLEGAPVPTTPISPGELEINLSVQVVYSILN